MGDRSGKAELKYLESHAEPEALFAQGLAESARGYGHVLVIPAAGEGAGIGEALSSIPEGPLGSVLTIVVVNATANAGAAVHAANEQSLAVIRRALGKGSPQRLSPNAVLYENSHAGLLVVDRASAAFRLPKGQGVGLARKIGADLALALRLAGHVRSPWIHMSDADVVFPEDYFAQGVDSKDDGVSAQLYRFRHCPGSGAEADEAAQQYEATLRYYVLGLRFAGSPYGFHSIGSTLAVHGLAYARVRGFPRRTAAEDFYLLNKLAKVGRVDSLEGAPLLLSSRISHRVPFGTGAAIAQMLEGRVAERSTYNPDLFHYLRAWLGALEQLAGQGGAKSGASMDVEACVRAQCEEAGTPVDPVLLQAALERTGALATAHTALAAPARALRGQLKDGFDGFRTLKLIHALRELGITDLPLRDALARASFLDFGDDGGALSSRDLASRMAELENAERDHPGERDVRPALEVH